METVLAKQKPGRKPMRKWKKAALYCTAIVMILFAALVIFIGSVLSADLLWNIADITMGAMAVINIPVIFILSKYALRALKHYESQRKTGEEICF